MASKGAIGIIAGCLSAPLPDSLLLKTCLSIPEGSKASISGINRIWANRRRWSASERAGIGARSSNGTFTESHILAITQAICEYRAAEGITGPVFLGKDTHAFPGVAQQTALEVLAANGSGDDDSGARRVYADSGDLARDSGLQPGADRRVWPMAS